jgi:hypothetical protein
VISALGAASWGLLAGCGQPQPHATTTNLALTPQEEREKLVLSHADEAEMLSALKSIAAGRTPVDPPAPAPLGMRWSDVPEAVDSACNEAGVEMVVVRKIEADDGRSYRFVLETIEDWPGELVVRKVDGPEVYAAEAWVGRFPTEPARVARKDALLSALEKHMRALGREPGYGE